MTGDHHNRPTPCRWVVCFEHPDGRGTHYTAVWATSEASARLKVSSAYGVNLDCIIKAEIRK